MNSSRFRDEVLYSCRQGQKKKEVSRQKLIVWLAPNDKEIENDGTNARYYLDVNQCVDEISELLGTDIYFFLKCATLSCDDIDNLVCILDSFVQIRRIYVVNSSPISFQLRKYSKAKQFLTEPSESQALREIRTYEEHVFFEFSTLDANTTLTHGTNNGQEAMFIYTQLFKQILLATNPTDFEQTERERAEMIAYFRHIYTQTDNRSALAFLDNYERTMNKYPIWWYTCDGFLYKTLNEACRSQDIETMYALRGYIRDLHYEIGHLYHPLETSLLLYRGQQISVDAFCTIKTKLNGLLSIHSFFSTTLNPDLALVFAGTTDNENNISVLFEITVLPCDTSVKPFANIDSVSVFGGAEQEYLFSFGCVFRINAVTQSSSFGDIWLIRLTFTTDNDPELANITEYMWATDLQGKNDETKFAWLMITLGETGLAGKVYGDLLQKPLHPEDLGFILHNLGYINQSEGHYDDALVFFNEALSYMPLCTENNNHSRIRTLICITQVYGIKEDWSASFECAQKALALTNDFIDNEDKADCLQAVGIALFEQKQYTDGIKYIQRALEIRRQILPPSHPSLGFTYNDLGLMYHRLQRYDEALSTYNEALKIRRRSLPEGHCIFAIMYNNIANTLYWMERDDEALELSAQALQIATITLGADHPTTNICRDTFDGISAGQEVNCENGCGTLTESNFES